jgi:mannose-6-phosphate isomerase-like protein (cupin superfamily)
MSSRPTVRVVSGHFESKEAVLAEISLDSLWPVTRSQGAFESGPLHYHDEPVRIYVFEGTLFVYVESDGPPIPARAGAKIEIPAGALHALSAEGHVVTITALANAKATEGLPQLLPK